MSLRNFSTLIMMCGALAAVAACSVKIDDTDGASASGSTGAASTGEASTGGATTGEASTGGTGSASASSTDATTSTTSTTTEPSTTTSTSAGSTTTPGEVVCDCAEDEWCDWSANSCGDHEDDVWTCVKKPDACDAIFQPVCGCDKMVHGNACSGESAGIDVAAAGGCPPPEGMFPCGFAFCDLKTSYCEVLVSDVVGFPDIFTCKSLPDSCDPNDCACLADVPCGGMCEAVDGGGLKVSCPGG